MLDAVRPAPVVRNLVRPYRGRVALLAVTSFVGGFTEAGFLVVVTRLALAVAQGDERIRVGVELSLGQGVAAGFALLVLRLALGLGGVWVSAELTRRCLVATRRRLASTFFNASWETQQNERAGRLQQVLSEFVSRMLVAVGAVTNLTAAGLALSALLVASLVVDPVATLGVAVALAVLGSLLAPIRRRVRLRAGAHVKESMAFANAVNEFGSLGLEMQVFGVRDAFVELLARRTEAEASAARRVEHLRSAVPVIYVSLAYGALLAAVATASALGKGDLASVGAVMVVMLRSLSYGQQIQVASTSLRSATPVLETIEASVQTYEQAAAPQGDAVVATPGRIRFDRVEFAYRAGQPVLHDVSFAIEPGEVIGVVGPSGSGKSTLVQLLLGLRQPQHGRVLVDGIDLVTVDRRRWAEQVAFVPQEALLFSGTVAENIRFFRPRVTDDDVRTAAHRAHIHDDIVAMPDGYETQVGERGGRLSGGQRQRVSIARALAGQPAVLVLDEPTSALDARSEALIRDTLNDLRGEVTVVVIAHRLSTLDICDRIMVVQGGRIVAFDAPDRLADLDGFYREALIASGFTGS